MAAALRNPLSNPNKRGPVGDTALSFACYSGYASVAKLLLADKRVDPTIANHYGKTALMIAAQSGHARVVTLLLADRRVEPDASSEYGNTALMLAAHNGHGAVLELLLADHRTSRARPRCNSSNGAAAASSYDAALFNVKYARHARLKGLVRAMVAFRRMRLRAALTVYAPGGTGYAAASANFEMVVAEAIAKANYT